ncbi:MAG: hypothetical protein ACP5XB_01090 [Isosphaeraceae bacterium]
MFDDDNPYAAPKSEPFAKDPYFDASTEAWRDGELLVVRKGAELVDRCLKCGEPTDGYRFSRVLYWHKPIYYLVFFLISPLLYILIYFFIRWQGKVTVSLCARHRRKRAWAITLGWLTALAGLGMFIALGVLSDSGDLPDSLKVILPMAGFVLLLAGIIGGIVGAQVLVPKKIDAHFIWLNKVSPHLLMELPDWNTPQDLPL